MDSILSFYSQFKHSKVVKAQPTLTPITLQIPIITPMRINDKKEEEKLKQSWIASKQNKKASYLCKKTLNHKWTIEKKYIRHVASGIHQI